MTLMTVESANTASEESLKLSSQIADLALVPPWIERLASEYEISPKIQLAMNLCLEEVLSNIMRYGYANKPGMPIVVRYSVGQDKSSLLVIEDEAPPFNLLIAEETPVEETLEGRRIGGLGLRLVRRFATTLKYEPTPVGNRLSIGFRAEQT